MSVVINDNWEHSLLGLASEAWHAVAVHQPARSESAALLREAYTHCESLTAEHSRSFFLASGLMKPEIRRAVRALYAFCRTTDDIVDNAAGDVHANLRAWREHALSWHPPKHDLVAVAWADARARYAIPQRYAEQLIEGVAMDVAQSSYDTFDELTTYCYGVASTVGLMSMHITGYESDEAVRYAIRLGVALQLTNILRDVAEDWQRGRIYLPQEELREFELSNADIARSVESGAYDQRWRAFMQFQVARAHHIYEEAWPGIRMLHPQGRLAIAAAATFYRAILNDIAAHDYDVFSRRAHVSKWGKLRRLPALWWQTRGGW